MFCLLFFLPVWLYFLGLFSNSSASFSGVSAFWDFSWSCFWVRSQGLRWEIHIGRWHWCRYNGWAAAGGDRTGTASVGSAEGADSPDGTGGAEAGGGRSVTKDGAKSTSWKTSRLNGQIPVHLKPDYTFAGVAANGRANLTMPGMSYINIVGLGDFSSKSLRKSSQLVLEGRKHCDPMAVVCESSVVGKKGQFHCLCRNVFLSKTDGMSGCPV